MGSSYDKYELNCLVLSEQIYPIKIGCVHPFKLKLKAGNTHIHTNVLYNQKIIKEPVLTIFTGEFYKPRDLIVLDYSLL